MIAAHEHHHSTAELKKIPNTIKTHRVFEGCIRGASVFTRVLNTLPTHIWLEGRLQANKPSSKEILGC